MAWKVPKIWEEGEVWILGGGASVLDQFDVPKELVEDVLSKKETPEVYSEYMAPIHDKHIIGINMAYKIGDWLDILFFGDLGFFVRNEHSLANTSSLKVSCHPKASKVDWIKYLEKDRNHVRGISEIPGKVSWNGNSGAAAINLAFHLGAKRIILLGFDMKLEEGKQHWHNLYDTKNKKRFVYPFAKHLRGFPIIHSDSKRLGVEIINASPNSTIKEFKKIPVKDLL